MNRSRSIVLVGARTVAIVRVWRFHRTGPRPVHRYRLALLCGEEPACRPSLNAIDKVNLYKCLLEKCLTIHAGWYLTA